MATLPPGFDPSQVPLAANPDGSGPNFVDPPNLISTVQGVGCTLAIISSALVVLRVTIYAQAKRPIGLDDVSLVLSLAFAVSYTGVVGSMGPVFGHAWDTPLGAINAEFLKKNFTTSLLYGPMLFFSKATILILYWRTFSPYKWLRIGVCIIFAVLIPSYWMTVPLCFIYCMPHDSAGWNLALLPHCATMATPGLVQAAVNIAADFVTILLPLPVIYKLQVPLGKKIALACIFATGLLALVASALTIRYRIRIITSIDSNWASAQTQICIQAETYASICAACMPALAKLWKIKVRETKIYSTLRWLLRSTRSLSANGTADTSKLRSKPTCNLRKASYDELRGSSEASMSLSDNRIYKTTAVELASIRKTDV